MNVDAMFTNWCNAQFTETTWFENNRRIISARRNRLGRIDQSMVAAHPQFHPILLRGKAGDKECSYMTQYIVPEDPDDLCVDHIADLRLAEKAIKKRLEQLTHEALARVEGYTEWLGSE